MSSVEDTALESERCGFGSQICRRPALRLRVGHPVSPEVGVAVAPCSGVLVAVGPRASAAQISAPPWVTCALQRVCPGHVLAFVVHPGLSPRCPCASASWPQNGRLGARGACDSGQAGGVVAASGQHTQLSVQGSICGRRARPGEVAAPATFGASASGAWGPEDAALARGMRGVTPVPPPGQLRQLQHELEDCPLHEVE